MNDDAKHKRRPVQFGLRTFFLVAVVVAIVLPGLVNQSDAVTNITVAAIELAAVVAAIVGAVNPRGHFQSFCLGVLVPAISTHSMDRLETGVAMALPDSAGGYPFYLFIFEDLALYVACGIFAVVIRWMLAPRDNNRPGDLGDAAK